MVIDVCIIVEDILAIMNSMALSVVYIWANTIGILGIIYVMGWVFNYVISAASMTQDMDWVKNGEDGMEF